MHTVDKLQEVNMSPAWMPVLDLQYQSIIFLLILIWIYLRISFLVHTVFCSCFNYTHFCHDHSRRDWHGNVHGNVNVFGLGGIDLLHYCGRASSKTCYCQYIHSCEHVINTAAAHTTYMK